MSHMNPGDLPTWFRKEIKLLKCNPQVWQHSNPAMTSLSLCRRLSPSSSAFIPGCWLSGSYQDNTETLLWGLWTFAECFVSFPRWRHTHRPLASQSRQNWGHVVPVNFPFEETGACCSYHPLFTTIVWMVLSCLHAVGSGVLGIKINLAVVTSPMNMLSRSNSGGRSFT